MRLTKLFGRTSKTEGADFKIASHKLLVQAGFIRESTAGRYYMLPLGLKVHEKITSIIRKHMNEADAQEVVMPVLHPLELWQETNRTTTTGFELMKVEDRRGGGFVLGGTAEEMAVDLVRKFNISYKDLPFNIYQFSMKFRDELRARGGLLRVREFVMKDAYSFGTEPQFKQIYDQMWQAYVKIFSELGLEVDVVAADNGYIGGEYCHEFVSPSVAGESRYFIDVKSGYAAHEDVAVVKFEAMNLNDERQPIKEVAAKRGPTMKAGAELHNLPLWQQIKDVLYFDETTKRYILVVIRGDLEVNETKLTHVANAWNLRPATDQEIREDLNSEPGFICPVDFVKKGQKTGYQVLVVGDKSLRSVCNMYGGANKKFVDNLNINIDVDYQVDLEADVALAQPGMLSPDGGAMEEKLGIEVGNIFQLGHHYSNLMTGAEYTDDAGLRQKYYMGCYGIGIGRTMAAIVEKNHDQKGIIWPESIAPYKVYLARLGDDADILQQSDNLYDKMKNVGIDVLYDDRDARAGEKFADADLLGIPHRVVVSEKSIKNGGFEYKLRTSKTPEFYSLEDIIAKLA